MRENVGGIAGRPTFTHYHVFMTRSGSDVADVGAFQFKDVALEMLRDIDQYMACDRRECELFDPDLEKARDEA